MITRRVLVAAFAVGMVLTACRAAEPADAATVHLSEFAIDIDHPTWGPGAVELTLVNDGEFAHAAVVTGETGEVVAATGIIHAGTTAEVSVDLPAGTYEVTCRIVAQTPDGTIVDHFEAGMRTEVTITG